ncbi:MAG: DUF1684 domain-containing protein [Cyclobacteriaceae bacterium]|nr:DUF1684 domain-containing protein [Cyclobacteriaceae bacterium]
MSMKPFYVLFILIAFWSTAVSSQNVKKENKAYRKKLNKAFKDPTESPLTKEDFKLFKKLVFFPFDEAYKVPATLVVNTLPQFFKMPTTTSRMPIYSTYGRLVFTISGVEYSLQVYQNQDLKNKSGYEDYLFVPFTDITNGEDTYEGGRYLDFRIPKTEEVIIDFNKAYNPYCAYSDRYSCPKVPIINNLPIRITAGVKKWR